MDIALRGVALYLFIYLLTRPQLPIPLGASPARRRSDCDRPGRAPDRANLRRERITADEVAQQARAQQIASLEDVQWAVFEPSGAISFIPKNQ